MIAPRDRHLLRELVRRDLEQRTRGSVPGFLWSLAEPAWQLLLYTFVFSVVLRVGLAGEATDRFALFLFAGLVAWLPVRQGIERAATAIVDSAALIRSHRFPPALFVVAVVIAEVIHGAAAVVLFVVVLLATGSGLGSVWLLALLLPLQVALAIGIALLVAAGQVYARDLRRALGLALTTWFFATPIVYPLGRAPDSIRTALELNPATGLVELARAALLGGTPRPLPMLALAVGGLVMLVVGALTFQRLAPGFVDEI